jgi:hypothetical protein
MIQHSHRDPRKIMFVFVSVSSWIAAGHQTKGDLDWSASVPVALSRFALIASEDACAPVSGSSGVDSLTRQCFNSVCKNVVS